MSPPDFLNRMEGSSSVEFALILPVLVILLFGGLEGANFVWQQHKLTEAVRDGARFASRMNIEDLCDGETDVNDTDYQDAVARIKFYTRTGVLPTGNQQTDGSAMPRVWNWNNDNQVTFDAGCGDFVATGLYSALTNADGNAGQRGPIATVTGEVPYRSLFRGLGLDGAVVRNLRLRASSRAAVIGL